MRGSIIQKVAEVVRTSGVKKPTLAAPESRELHCMSVPEVANCTVFPSQKPVRCSFSEVQIWRDLS